MLKLIIGVKGTGKTKQLIEMVNTASEQSNGSVVCIEKGTKLTYDIKHTARLIDTDQYGICDAQSLFGFIAGIIASNHDVTDIYIDSALKICKNDVESFDNMLDEINALSEKHELHCTMTVSIADDKATDTIKKYI
ncbi:MAG: hypothetical protein E7632_03090 [Ruminococcaceae bacterium]|nr:hypothetical protein [Oscillospiraceae bacterium]